MGKESLENLIHWLPSESVPNLWRFEEKFQGLRTTLAAGRAKLEWLRFWLFTYLTILLWLVNFIMEYLSRRFYYHPIYLNTEWLAVPQEYITKKWNHYFSWGVSSAVEQVTADH